ncbi:PepSY domain-containing protein [Alkalibacillus silvisoli]|uniref:PepSY domain-containing protein n=1 Tax=Alkalibacillus silvisoli TaxID=392823 RepID=A0ABN0ZQM1_9BACI
MKWYKLAIPAAIGITVGSILGKKIKEHWLIPEVALKRVKEQFKQSGPISGSWILMEQEEYAQAGKLYTVYQGGVSRTVDGRTEHYKFYADATNGEILETYILE